MLTSHNRHQWMGCFVQLTASRAEICLWAGFPLSIWALQDACLQVHSVCFAAVSFQNSAVSQSSSTIAACSQRNQRNRFPQSHVSKLHGHGTKHTMQAQGVWIGTVCMVTQYVDNSIIAHCQALCQTVHSAVWGRPTALGKCPHRFLLLRLLERELLKHLVVNQQCCLICRLGCLTATREPPCRSPLLELL